MIETITNPAFVIGACAIAIVAYMIYESNWLEVTETTLEFDDLPPGFDGFRILMISDFHSYSLDRYERRIMDRVREIDADLLVIAGDMKAYNVTPNEPIVELLDAILEATKDYPCKPVYSRGNHDRRGFSDLVGQRDDVEELRDRHVVIERDGDRIAIAGVRRTARKPRRMRPSLRKALRDRPEDAFTILVSHSPDFFRMAARRGVDLVLSGDTHGGQICIPYFGSFQSKSRLGRDCNRGVVQRFGGTLFVSRGLGTTGPPFRMACRPEIAVLVLRRSNSSQ